MDVETRMETADHEFHVRRKANRRALTEAIKRLLPEASTETVVQLVTMAGFFAEAERQRYNDYGIEWSLAYGDDAL